MKYAQQCHCFQFSLEQQLSISPKNTGSSVRIPRTVPDVQWLLCCSFGIDTRWLNHLEKNSSKFREASKFWVEERHIETISRSMLGTVFPSLLPCGFVAGNTSLGRASEPLKKQGFKHC